MFNSVEVTSMRGLGSGHSKPVEVTFGPSDSVSEAGAAEPPPQAVNTMLAITNTPNNPYRFFLFISSSLEVLNRLAQRLFGREIP
jgi:uncharacterized membrane protein